VTILRRLLGGGDRQVERARRPQALAASRGGNVQEGLNWLRRPPSRRAPLLYRILLGLGELFLFGLCRIRVEAAGREQLPSGGYIAAAALHRGWIDPIVVLHVVPREPRVWFLGSAASVFDRRWKEMLLRRTGGLLPVWRGGGIDVHVQAARAVAGEGAVLCLFIEGAIVGPPNRVWPGVRSGTGLLTLRTGMPIVPIALVGSDQLYRGRRIACRLLPPTNARELAADQWPTPPPQPNTREELRLARLVTQRIAAQIDAALPELSASIEEPPGTRHRWTWLTGLMR
jgi:1-acyl-sn-glycerol-3-phosphate acyltransferase